MNVKRTPEKEVAFLAALAATGNVTKAAKAAGLGRMTVYEWKQDPAFDERWGEALKIGADALEDHANERASEGWLEPVFYEGKEVATVRKYSDTLLIFLLKGLKPDKFRDNAKVELAGSLNVHTMTDEDILEELTRLQASGVALPFLSGAEPDDGSDLV